MKRVLGICILLFGLHCAAFSQDLNASVKILSPKIQSPNKRIFQTLETAIKDFLNGRKWSQDNILPAERIDCTFLLNITTWDGSSAYSGELQVLSTRPVFNSGYNTTVLNMLDKYIEFTYTEGQIMDYTDQNYQSNLTSLLAFYAYIIVGMDYDTFSLYGGSVYFAAAQNVVVNAGTSSYTGWKEFDANNINRYWLAENLNGKTYANLRNFSYNYHRNGLDVMADNSGKGRKAIADLIPGLTSVDRQSVGAMYPTVFFTAKSDELIAIFSKADPQQRVQVMNVLNQVDPANGLKYQAAEKAN
jgi:hypothetical protein